MSSDKLQFEGAQLTKRPNYILFITDQHRADFLGCYGHPVLRTPNIDALAKDGIAFDRFYVASPVCMPNRASLMTGRMPSSHGVRSNGIPLAHRNVTFVEMLRAAGYDTALIGKSHLQNVTRKAREIPPRPVRKAMTQPPEDLSQTIRSDFEDASYQQENPASWDKPGHKVSLPFYGFDHVDLVTGHGTLVGGDYANWLLREAPEIAQLRGRDKQLAHDYVCPQAVRTAVPEEYYSTSYIARKACDWLRARGGNEKPFFLMVSWPDPHHPFNPPGKYWDMYRPKDMEVPAAFMAQDWEPPRYVVLAEQARKDDGDIGKKGGKTIAVTKQEALEARALTCGMISMIDDAIGQVRKSVEETGASQSTVQIFTTDHGDHLGDHRLLFKGAEQYDTLTRVPFIWADPMGASGERTDELAQTIDIGATILEHARVEGPEGVQGLPMSVVGGSGRDAVLIQYDSQRTIEPFGPQPRVHSVIDGHYRLSIYQGPAENELFDLVADPGEMTNLWDNADYAEVRANLTQKLAELEIAAVDRTPMPTAEA